MPDEVDSPFGPGDSSGWDRGLWTVGDRALHVGEIVTVVPTSDKVSRDLINVMQHGTGSIRTARVVDLTSPAITEHAQIDGRAYRRRVYVAADWTEVPRG